MLRCLLLTTLAAVCFSFTPELAAQTLFINEICAENVGQVLTSTGQPSPSSAALAQDLDGNTTDWLELRNSSGVSVNLAGWALSDNPAVLDKWEFPSTTILANSYRQIFASGKDWKTGSQLHTNFKLGNSGVLILSQNVGGVWTIRHQIGDATTPYPAQKVGFSYGYSGTSGPAGALGFLEQQTPGFANPSGVVTDFVADTNFSVKRGLYDAPQSVVVTTATLGATLIYTLDGSEPTTTNSAAVQVPAANGSVAPSATVNITTTTCLRARAIKAGFGASNVDTQTYIFPQAVLGQDESYITQPFVGWGHDKGDPDTTQGEIEDADWAMDPRVTGHLDPADRCVADDLKAIPSISVVLNWADMFGSGGIYIGGEGVEKRASFEVLNPAGSKVTPNTSGGQENGVVHIFGGSSTGRWKTDKLSMRFKFWEDLSTSVLGDSAIGSYDTLVLDARLNQVWTHSQDQTQRNRGDYVRDAVMNDFEQAMGNHGTASQHIHLYINGIYWGIYTLHERPDEHFTAAYFGGSDDDYDIVKHAPTHPNFLVSGLRINPLQGISNTNHTAGVNYQALLNLSNAALSTQGNYEALAAKLDIPHFINYMLLNFYGANTDWAHQNWYASFNRADPGGKWRFHSWDAEHVFKAVGDDSTDRNDASGPTGIHKRLMANAEYRRMFGDAAHQLLFNGGLFTPAKAKALFGARLMTIDEAIRAESARWGDNGPFTQTSPTSELHLRSTDVGGFLSWMTERNRILNSILDGGTNRTTVLISDLKAQGTNPSLYPQAGAPVFNQHGGFVAANFGVTMTNPNAGTSTIYYRLDGMDPRVEWTGAVRAGTSTYSGAVALAASGSVKARVLHSTLGWSALNEAYFSVDTVPAAAGNLVISKIHYRPAALTPAELAAGFSERSDFEFLEVLNVSANRVNLDGLTFSAGLDIAAITDAVRELEPGGRALYVAKPSAFEFRYGPGHPIAGEFILGSNLSNDGETLTLHAADGSIIVSITYNDVAPWPAAPDGTGPSLVLMQPGVNDPALGSNWRQSTANDGAPGVDDRLYFNVWQTAQFPGGGPNAALLADPEGDGLPNVAEFGLGTDPNVFTPPNEAPFASTQLLDLGAGPKPYLIFTVRRLKAAEQLTWTAEGATTLPNWSSGAGTIVPLTNPVDNGDGTETRLYRAAQPIDAGGAQFFRAKVTAP